MRLTLFEGFVKGLTGLGLGKVVGLGLDGLREGFALARVVGKGLKGLCSGPVVYDPY